ncbi:unnamed protein product [Closterium sp. NIES-54]
MGDTLWGDIGSGALSLVVKLYAPSVVKAGEAAVLRVRFPACLTRTVTRANDIRAANTTPRRPTLSKPLTKLLGRRGLAPTLLLLPVATARTSLRNSSNLTATTPTAANTATPTAATTAATKAPTSATTPTAATTSATSTTSTAAPTTTPAATATTLLKS